MKKLLSLCAAVCCMSLAFAANNVITYRAASQLPEKSFRGESGFHPGEFGDVTMTAHEFANGEGTITFSGDVKCVGYNAFNGCHITSINLPATIDSIGDAAFAFCDSLSTIVLPENVTKLGKSIFSTSAIKTFTFPKRIKEIPLNMFIGCDSLVSVTLNDSIITIGETAFSETGIQSIVLPNSVKTIGPEAFRQCGLVSIVLPEGLEVIEEKTFQSCGQLESITLPQSLKKIYSEGVAVCTSLKTLNIPQNVDSIAPDAFALSSMSLTSITVDKNNTRYDSRNNCNAIIETTTNKLMLACANALIAEEITAFDEYAYSACMIDTIVIPKNVTSIGMFSFYYCMKLKTAYYLASCVPTISDYTFYGIDAEATLYVQPELVDSFKAATGWSTFKYILPLETPTPTAVENASVVELYAENGRIVCEGEFRIYDLLGRDVTRMNGTLNGVYVVTCGNKATKIVVK